MLAGEGAVYMILVFVLEFLEDTGKIQMCSLEGTISSQPK
jgi:hypothetical protein